MGITAGPSGVIGGSGGIITSIPIVTPPPGGGGSNAENFVILSDPNAVGASDYPLQLGRAFLEGEIADYPEILVNGSAIPTQAQVEQRWPDTSVKHAILFCIIPTIPAAEQVVLTFRNQATGLTSGGLTAANVLSDWDFDATIALTQGVTEHVASARDMLTGGHYTTLYSGSIATTFICADHSASETYDIGWDAYTPIRPIFHVTFWAGVEKYSVRYIAELSKTTEQENVAIDNIVATVGDSSPSTVYTKATTTNMNYGSRWTKFYWAGTEPIVLNINHNLAYEKTTGLLPNFDTDLIIPSATIASKYAGWTAASKNLYDAGNWQKSMPNVGGRADIGVYPGWVVWWLYTGDYRMKEMAFGNADLAGAWPMHYREAQYGRTRKFERTGSVDAGGKILSINTRPTTFLWYGFNGAGNSTAVGDRITAVGTLNANGWSPDCSHQPDPYTPLYLLTGDFWYLEQAWFWAAWSAAHPSPANIYYGHRGPEGWYGGLEITNELRTAAWPFRSRVHTASITPDRFSDEKTYFNILIEDAIAIFEGLRIISGSSRSSHPGYIWSSGFRTNKWKDINGNIPSPLHHFGTGGNFPSLSVIDWTVTNGGAANWQQGFMSLALGRAKDLGYDVDDLLEFIAPFYTERVVGGDISPFSISSYYEPVNKVSPLGEFFTWDNVVSGYSVSGQDFEGAWNGQIQDVVHGYANIAMAAASYFKDQTDGEAMWAWYETNARNSTCLARLATDPKWALIPRT